MCYAIYVSTTSREDFGELPSKLYQFLQITPEDDPIYCVLEHPNLWRVACPHGGCSCHFRHLACGGSDQYFGPPQDWHPEDAADIEATGAFYEVIERLITEGHNVDLVDWWNDTPSEEISTLDVSLGEVSQEEFRFFENCRFRVKR